MSMKTTSTDQISKRELLKKINLHGHRLKDALHFVSRFIRKPSSVGSIWPSSQHLGKVMIENIPMKAGDVIIEYGPGTGPFTHLLRDYIPQGIEYLGIEHDHRLYKGLCARFPEMRFHHGSAEDAPALLKHYGLAPARLIISGLPFANMPPPLQERILQATQKALRSDGIFRTFTYLLSGIRPHAVHFRKMVSRYFLFHHERKKVMRNFPPAQVLSYSHPIERGRS
ncbi:MAG: hypothetical protein A3F67_08670 [Verrucomicrobia bacterium RIFCSPHIGHO2_12_FULL_41_10]|nr:MAG: hypothetical protein A3F67_08670 [Verrucomicrobia bacterium RIFCSPHIGHO2_12_FULL_41_10]